MRYALLIPLVLLGALSPSHWYATQTRLDPILAEPGVDTLAMSAAVHDLQATVDTIASFYPVQEAHTIRTSLAPTRSLLARTRLEAARRAFLENPTHMRMAIYAFALERTLALIAADAHTLEHALLEDAATPMRMSFIDATASRATLAQDFEGLRAAIRGAQVESRRRLGCALPLRDCPLRSPPEPVAAPPLSRTFSEADADALRVLDIIHESLDVHESSEPMLLRMRSVCSPERETFLQVSSYAADGERSARRTFSLPTILMHQYSSSSPENAKGRNPVIDAFFSAHGVEYTYQPDGNFYVCIAAGADVATVGRLLGVRDSLSKAESANARSLSYVPHEIRSRITGGVLDEYDVGKALAYLHAAAVTEESSDPFIFEILAQANAGSFGYESVIDAATQMHDFMLGLLRSGHGRPPLEAILVTRSFPTVVFPFYNRTLMREAPVLAADTTTSIITDRHISSYAELRETVPAHILDEALMHYARFMNELRSDAVSR